MPKYKNITFYLNISMFHVTENKEFITFNSLYSLKLNFFFWNDNPLLKEKEYKSHKNEILQ